MQKLSAANSVLSWEAESIQVSQDILKTNQHNTRILQTVALGVLHLACRTPLIQNITQSFGKQRALLLSLQEAHVVRAFPPRARCKQPVVVRSHLLRSDG